MDLGDELDAQMVDDLLLALQAGFLTVTAAPLRHLTWYSGCFCDGLQPSYPLATSTLCHVGQNTRLFTRCVADIRNNTVFGAKWTRKKHSMLDIYLMLVMPFEQLVEHPDIHKC